MESEIACDAEAVHSGLKPSVYASELLAIAKSLGRDARLSSLAIGMTRTRYLEARLQAVLTPHAQSKRSGRLALSASLTAFAVAASAITPRSIQQPINQGESTMKNTILSALFTSVSLSAATVSGSVTGPAGEAIPDAKVLVYNPDSGAKQEVTTSSDGKFSVAGTGAGQYILRVAKPGFNSSFRAFDLKADSTVNRQITMAAPGTQQVPDSISDPDSSESKPIRIGGMVAQSNLVTKVQPLYPAAAKAARVQGTVELEITVTKDGVPAELRVVSSPSDDLSESALEAVRQWRYRPTLLNGSPVEIISSVIVNYTLAP
jgi:TonB family protein